MPNIFDVLYHLLMWQPVVFLQVILMPVVLIASHAGALRLASRARANKPGISRWPIYLALMVFGGLALGAGTLALNLTLFRGDSTGVALALLMTACAVTALCYALTGLIGAAVIATRDGNRDEAAVMSTGPD